MAYMVLLTKTRKRRLFQATTGALLVACTGVAAGCGSENEAVGDDRDAGDASAVSAPDAGTGRDGDADGRDASGIADADAALPWSGNRLSAGGRSSCAILEKGFAKCWGRNHAAVSGVGDANLGDVASELGPTLPAINLGTGRTVLSIAAGDAHTCAILDNGAVKCWGASTAGRLGIEGSSTGQMGDALPAVNLGTGRTALQVEVGSGHTCAILDDFSLKCWGLNNSGQLGLGDTNNRGDSAGEMGDALPRIELGTGRTARQVRAGQFHTCAILDDSSLKCWGMNNSGQLGLGDANSRGENPGAMGDALPAVNLGTGRTALQIDAGDNHTCAILDDGSVKCWGYGGRLGLGDTGYRGDNSGEMGDALPAVQLGTGRTARKITAGGYHTCVILDDGSLKCWGYSEDGQLGLGDKVQRGEGPGEMGDALPAIDLGAGHVALEVGAALLHTCARLDDGTIKCWGRNAEGQLGLGDSNARGDGPGEMGAALPPARLE